MRDSRLRPLRASLTSSIFHRPSSIGRPALRPLTTLNSKLSTIAARGRPIAPASHLPSSIFHRPALRQPKLSNLSNPSNRGPLAAHYSKL
ncbi:MAG: hypothetical protein K6F94_05630 [Bacteroidaceae bacterium]|nr:hypothetical protein [Bacteroidaceae bacterium]